MLGAVGGFAAAPLAFALLVVGTGREVALGENFCPALFAGFAGDLQSIREID